MTTTKTPAYRQKEKERHQEIRRQKEETEERREEMTEDFISSIFEFKEKLVEQGHSKEEVDEWFAEFLEGLLVFFATQHLSVAIEGELYDTIIDEVWVPVDDVTAGSMRVRLGKQTRLSDEDIRRPTTVIDADYPNEVVG